MVSQDDEVNDNDDYQADEANVYDSYQAIDNYGLDGDRNNIIRSNQAIDNHGLDGGMNNIIRSNQAIDNHGLDGDRNNLIRSNQAIDTDLSVVSQKCSKPKRKRHTIPKGVKKVWDAKYLAEKNKNVSTKTEVIAEKIHKEFPHFPLQTIIDYLRNTFDRFGNRKIKYNYFFCFKQPITFQPQI